MEGSPQINAAKESAEVANQLQSWNLHEEANVEKLPVKDRPHVQLLEKLERLGAQTHASPEYTYVLVQSLVKAGRADELEHLLGPPGSERATAEMCVTLLRQLGCGEHALRWAQRHLHDPALALDILLHDVGAPARALAFYADGPWRQTAADAWTCEEALLRRFGGALAAQAPDAMAPLLVEWVLAARPAAAAGALQTALACFGTSATLAPACAFLERAVGDGNVTRLPHAAATATHEALLGLYLMDVPARSAADTRSVYALRSVKNELRALELLRNAATAVYIRPGTAMALCAQHGFPKGLALLLDRSRVGADAHLLVRCLVDQQQYAQLYQFCSAQADPALWRSAWLHLLRRLHALPAWLVASNAGSVPPSAQTLVHYVVKCMTPLAAQCGPCVVLNELFPPGRLSRDGTRALLERAGPWLCEQLAWIPAELAARESEAGRPHFCAPRALLDAAWGLVEALDGPAGDSGVLPEVARALSDPFLAVRLLLAVLRHHPLLIDGDAVPLGSPVSALAHGGSAPGT